MNFNFPQTLQNLFKIFLKYFQKFLLEIHFLSASYLDDTLFLATPIKVPKELRHLIHLTRSLIIYRPPFCCQPHKELPQPTNFSTPETLSERKMK